MPEINSLQAIKFVFVAWPFHHSRWLNVFCYFQRCQPVLFYYFYLLLSTSWSWKNLFGVQPTTVALVFLGASDWSFGKTVLIVTRETRSHHCNWSRLECCFNSSSSSRLTFLLTIPLVQTEWPTKGTKYVLFILGVRTETKRQFET